MGCGIISECLQWFHFSCLLTITQDEYWFISDSEGTVFKYVKESNILESTPASVGMAIRSLAVDSNGSKLAIASECVTA